MSGTVEGTSDGRASNPWGRTDDVSPADLIGGALRGDLVAAHRELDAALAGAGLPDEVAVDVIARLRELTALASAHHVPEPARHDGVRPDLPGRGHPLLPPYLVDEMGTGAIRGRVTFSRFHLGGNSAVHGGVLPLLFDDALGYVANHQQDGIARTAYLTTNYRAVTPLDVELRYEATLDRQDGRKRFASGRLFGPDGSLLADAEGLFIRLLPGQP